jgi:hypothetical protein
MDCRLTIPPGLVDTILPDTFSHLGNLELDELTRGVTVSMILDQEGVCFFLSAVRHEESRGFWNKEYRDHDDGTCESLEDEGDLPRQIRVDEIAPVRHGGSSCR